MVLQWRRHSWSKVAVTLGTSQVANVVVEKDLEHLLQLIETKGGKMEWQSMMGHSTSNLTYQAWRLDLEAITALKKGHICSSMEEGRSLSFVPSDWQMMNLY
ncbi:unnamed protein product [Camellia sinensis]